MIQQEKNWLLSLLFLWPSLCIGYIFCIIIDKIVNLQSKRLFIRGLGAGQDVTSLYLSYRAPQCVCKLRCGLPQSY